MPWLLAALLTCLLVGCTLAPEKVREEPQDDIPTPWGTPASTQTEAPAASSSVGSGSGSKPSEVPFNRDLIELLGMVPLEFSDHTLAFSFADPDVRGDYMAIGNGRAMHPEIRTRIVQLNELMGLDFTHYERGIWSWRELYRTPAFMAFRGAIARQGAKDKLGHLGYQEQSHYDTTYYELNEDYAIDIAHPLRQSGLDFNRLVLSEDTVLAAPATNIIESLITVRRGDTGSLADSATHTSLVNSAGDGLVSGAFFGPQWISKTRKSVIPEQSDWLDRYREGRETWDTLSAYSLALIGYRMKDNQDEFFMALYFPTSTDIEATSRELEARWDGYSLDPYGQKPGVEYVPLNQVCSPLSFEIIRDADGSILVGTCPLIGIEDDSSGISGPSLWTWLFYSRRLEFLALDIRNLD